MNFNFNSNENEGPALWHGESLLKASGSTLAETVDKYLIAEANISAFTCVNPNKRSRDSSDKEPMQVGSPSRPKKAAKMGTGQENDIENGDTQLTATTGEEESAEVIQSITASTDDRKPSTVPSLCSHSTLLPEAESKESTVSPIDNHVFVFEGGPFDEEVEKLRDASEVEFEPEDCAILNSVYDLLKSNMQREGQIHKEWKKVMKEGSESLELLDAVTKKNSEDVVLDALEDLQQCVQLRDLLEKRMVALNEFRRATVAEACDLLVALNVDPDSLPWVRSFKQCWYRAQAMETWARACGTSAEAQAWSQERRPLILLESPMEE